MKIVRARGALRPDLLPSVDDLERATRLVRASDVVSKTPLLRAEILDRSVDPSGGTRVWLALECLQPTGSFKIRGALAALTRAKERGEPRIVAASAGNHGAGVAAIAAALDLDVTIVVPVTSPRKKVDAIRSHGPRITVIEDGDGYDAAEAVAIALAAERGEPFVSPYDDIDILAGNGGSLADELASLVSPRPLAVIAPVGGGGLVTGLACGFARVNREPYGASRFVWGAQSEASAAYAMSLERGSAVTTLPFAETLADGLEGGISVDAFARAAGVTAGALVVTEAQIAEAMRFAFTSLGLVIEGSAAAALAPLLAAREARDPSAAPLIQELTRDTREGEHERYDLLVVVTGRNVDRERLAGTLVW